MWLTLLVIAFLTWYEWFLFRKSKYFFVHSLFLVPLFATIFFIDHNASRVFHGLDRDAVPPIVKLIPVYVATFLMYRRRVPIRMGRQPIPVLLINGFLAWLLISTLISALWMGEWVPAFIVSFSIPIFWVVFNSQNVHEELSAIALASLFDRALLQVYYLSFFSVYILSLYYSISSGLTSSLLDSRAVGSIFASTSAIVFCVLYTPLLADITRTRYPYAVMALVCVLSLSKTALFLVPLSALLIYKNHKQHFKANRLRYYFLAGVCVLAFLYLMQTQWYEILAKFWVGKFTLGAGQSSFLEKAYFTRMKLYKVALDLIAKYPFGIGMGNFELFQQWGYKDPHNFVLTMLVEAGWIMGVPMILALVWIFARLFGDALKAARITFLHYTLCTVFLIYFTSSGVLAITGYPGMSVVYYTPFYGVAIFFHLNRYLRAGGPNPENQAKE